MEILINVPDLTASGGVAGYYRKLRPYLDRDVDFFEVGRRCGEQGKVARLCRSMEDFHRFYRQLRQKRYRLVVLNPSLGILSVIRDGIFHRIARHCGCKTVVFWRGWDLDFEVKLRKRRLWLYLFQRAYFDADKMIVLASLFKQHLREMGYQGTVVRSTTAVDEEYLHTPDRGFDRTRRNLLFLSRLERGKGILEALEAYRLLRLRRTDVVFTIVGDGPLREELQSRIAAQAIPDVVFTGALQGKEKLSEFLNADLFIFPSYTEGMPNVVLEAMSVGLPVVCSDVGGIPDMFVNGEMGFMLNGHKAEEFAQAITKLLDSPDMIRKISQNNREYARTYFAASLLAVKILQELQLESPQ